MDVDALEPFVQRVGSVMEHLDGLDRATAPAVREGIGYDELVDICLTLASHAAAPADHPGGVPVPAWYE